MKKHFLRTTKDLKALKEVAKFLHWNSYFFFYSFGLNIIATIIAKNIVNDYIEIMNENEDSDIFENLQDWYN